MDPYEELERCEGFDWDHGNRDKNWRGRRVTDAECEQIFFSEPLIAGKDFEHTRGELRFFVLGQTDAGRFLFVAFTIRNRLIRVISARDMTRREMRRYKS
jgi:uncharacterized DUF497 family protein